MGREPPCALPLNLVALDSTIPSPSHPQVGPGEHCHFVEEVESPLVGGIPTPLKNISQMGLLFPIYGKIKVPNHQPDHICQFNLVSVAELHFSW